MFLLTFHISSTHKQFYQKGIYDSPNCSRLKLNHAMLIVGYNNSTYRDYWIVKNRSAQTAQLKLFRIIRWSFCFPLLYIAGVSTGEWMATFT